MRDAFLNRLFLLTMMKTEPVKRGNSLIGKVCFYYMSQPSQSQAHIFVDLYKNFLFGETLSQKGGLFRMQKEKRILEKCKKRLLDKAKRKEVLLPQEQWLYDNIPMLLKDIPALPPKYKPLKKEAARLLPISPLREETLAQKLRKQKLSLTEDDVFMLPSVLKALYFDQAVMCASSPEKAKTDDIKEAITGFRAADRLNMKVLHPMISPVAALFSKDALFAASSHETRLCYIRAVKALSTASGLSEVVVAKKALFYAENDLSALLLGEKKNDFRLFLGLKKEKRISPSLYVWLLLGTVYAASFLF